MVTSRPNIALSDLQDLTDSHMLPNSIQLQLSARAANMG